MNANLFEGVFEDKKSKAHVINNSGNNEWYTPVIYLEAARKVLGCFDLDPASSLAANQKVRAKKFYTEMQNGLTQEWSGKVWLNPPYAKGLIEKFSRKLCSCFDEGTVTSAITLTNNATETKWFQRIASRATGFCAVSGRVSFWSPENKVSAPLQGQAFLYLGNNYNLFSEEFSSFGIVARITHAAIEKKTYW